ncbi:hypothetical protein E2C01_042545 [Portunus trituberculatus]|uniref:Uncharacterized protein n=1 Tax=Portunus trituberculatus TaxID=210409 RepID=A0A5B7FQI8_PORTR|nr:hypothetical protein [Portunus trituberculatus]
MCTSGAAGDVWRCAGLVGGAKTESPLRGTGRDEGHSRCPSLTIHPAYLRGILMLGAGTDAARGSKMGQPFLPTFEAAARSKGGGSSHQWNDTRIPATRVAEGSRRVSRLVSGH